MPKNLDISGLLDFYGDVLTDKQRDVMQQYYNEDLSLAEIAENFGITRQGVRDSIKRGENILLDLESKVGFVARHRKIESSLQELEVLTRDIMFRNDESVHRSNEVARQTRRMVELIARMSE